MSTPAPEALYRAAQNIAAQVGQPPAGKVLVVASPGKALLAGAVARGLELRGLVVQPLPLEPRPSDEAASHLAEGWGVVLLAEPAAAQVVFSLLGRADRGTTPHAPLPAHLFWDGLLSPEGVVRTWAIDLDETARFRQRLVNRLAGVGEIRVTTAAGTDLRLRPRDWLGYPNPCGEAYTAPLEESVEGTVIADGVAYSGPLLRPLVMRLCDGRIANLGDLDATDPQQRMALGDLTRDADACHVAELGIGINPGAWAKADIMEAEQARGTCHVGFGRNLAYGGAIESATHVDYTLLGPTILADGRPICRDGEYAL